VSSAGAAAVARSSAAPANKKQTPVSSTARQDHGGMAQRNGAVHSRPSSLTVNALQQPGITEEEAMRQAIALSLQNPSQQSSNMSSDARQRQTQEEADAALARALQESEREARANTLRHQQQTSTSNQHSCHIS